MNQRVLMTSGRLACPSRKQRHITEGRKQLRAIRKKWQKAEGEKREALNDVSIELRKNLLQLRRAEADCRKQREKQRQRKAFFNPFRFTANLLGNPKSGRLMCSKEEVEASVSEAHGNPNREVPLGDCPFQVPLQEPHTPFDMSDFTLDKVKAVVRKAWAGSTPGPSGTTYKIYKNCPRLLKKLAKLLRTL